MADIRKHADDNAQAAEAKKNIVGSDGVHSPAHTYFDTPTTAPDPEVVAVLANTPGDAELARVVATGQYDYDVLGGFHTSNFDEEVLAKLASSGVTTKALTEAMIYEMTSVARNLFDVIPELRHNLLAALQALGASQEQLEPVNALLSLPGMVLSIVSEMQRCCAYDQERASKMHQRFIVTRVNLDAAAAKEATRRRKVE